MKKIILGYVLFFAVLFAVFFGSRLYLLQSADSHKYKSGSGITYMAKTSGKDFMVFDNHKGWSKLFVAGVNIGTAKPGSYPGEFAVTKKEYLRWFQYISDMNANTIRVYTLQMPEFYEALSEFNLTAEKPLYLMQGIYLNEVDIAALKDAYADGGKIKNAFYSDIKNIVDVIHGRGNIKKEAGLAGGLYTADVSCYVFGWILGIEWDPDFVINTNKNNPAVTGYDGQYVTTKDASAFEAFLAEAADTAIACETDKYGEQRPVALCNWVTTDPLAHPGEPNKKEDAVSVDVEHIKPKSGFEAGFFASYHIYPYYPDFFSYENKYLKDGNTYRAYLEELQSRHTIPLLVAEVGIPASRGIAHENKISGFNQGHIEEAEQGRILNSLIGDIRSEGCMGALIFSWMDEWFKTTWNTMDLDIADRRAYWMDYQTNEQNFGLLSFDSGEKQSAVYVDGDISEWKESDLAAKTGYYKLYAKSDEKFLYLRADLYDFSHETVYIPIDTIAGQGNSSYNGVSLDSAADFMVVLSGREQSTVLIDPYYDPTYYQYAVKGTNLKRNPENEKTGTGKFTPITQVLSRALTLPETGETVPFRTVDAGKLKYGIANPKKEGYDSLADFCENDGHVEIRIPWLMLNVMDPSSKKVIGDMYKNNGITPQDVMAFRLGVVPSGGKQALLGEYAWQKWDKPSYHERLKKSYYIVQNTFETMGAANGIRRTPAEVFWAKWNQTEFSKIATWFPIQPVLNYMIAVLSSIIVYFFLVLLYIHIVSQFCDRSRKKIKGQVQKAVSLCRMHGLLANLPGSVKIKKLFSNNGLIIINELFTESSDADREIMRSLFCTRVYGGYIARRLKTRSMEDLILMIRLVGELRLKNLVNIVKDRLYANKQNIDLQYQAFLTLSLLACREAIVEICMDENFVHKLSFRSLQEVLKSYTGDKVELYRALLNSPDRFVRRICIKRIGIENFTEFAQDIFTCLDSEDYNTVIDAARTLGQLKYKDAAPRLTELLYDNRWELRSIAVSALGLIDVERNAIVIAKALHDREWQVRLNAAKALAPFSHAGELLQAVQATQDRFAFEILDYMLKTAQLRERKQ